MKIKPALKFACNLSQEISLFFFFNLLYISTMAVESGKLFVFFDGTNSPKIKVHTGVSNDNEKYKVHYI